MAHRWEWQVKGDTTIIVLVWSILSNILWVVPDFFKFLGLVVPVITWTSCKLNLHRDIMTDTVAFLSGNLLASFQLIPRQLCRCWDCRIGDLTVFWSTTGSDIFWVLGRPSEGQRTSFLVSQETECDILRSFIGHGRLFKGQRGLHTASVSHSPLAFSLGRHNVVRTNGGTGARITAVLNCCCWMFEGGKMCPNVTLYIVYLIIDPWSIFAPEYALALVPNFYLDKVRRKEPMI